MIKNLLSKTTDGIFATYIGNTTMIMNVLQNNALVLFIHSTLITYQELVVTQFPKAIEKQPERSGIPT